MRIRHRLFRTVRKLHLWVGLASALYFMLIAATGVAINHREGWKLGEKYIGRTWLPSSYRVDDGREVRSDIVVADLHSGLIFGRVGSRVMDVVAVVWFVSIISGLTMLALRKSLHSSATKRYLHAEPTTAPPAIPPQPEREPAALARK